MQIKLIFGPPGTGKTTKLLEILSNNLNIYHPEEIAYVSFTKEGSNQGKKRAINELNIQEKRMTYFRTLHSIAFRTLELKRSQIISKKDYKVFSEKMGMNFTGYYTEELRHNDDRYLFFNILHRNNHKTAKNYLYGLDTQILQHVNSNYKAFKEYMGIYDFTDIIERFNKLNKSLPVKIAIIDEAQDLSTLQWKMIWIAFRNCDTVYIAGDDDQAIYEWSGADVNYFLDINGEIEILKHSYRLPNDILDFSKSITKLITKRVDKQYSGLNTMGSVHYIESIKEVEFNKNETYMILSRNRYFLRNMELYLRSKGLLYIKYKEKSIKNEDIKIIKLYEKVRKTMCMNQIEENTLKKHLIQEYDLRNPWYDNFNWDVDIIDYYRDIIANKTDLSVFNIKIETIHSVKGDEADNVIVLTDITKQVYSNLQNNPDSEHRVFYVACTRAKKNLYILYGDSKYQYIFY
ncbi:MAG: UvrD-helicase domain-containing protein [Candidatus Lokiarchaeota archaeon]